MNRKELTIKKATGLKIASVMKEKGITNYRVRVDAGVQENTLKEILKGTGNYTYCSLVKVQIYLGIITEMDIERSEEILKNES